ncbi:MAG: hypothetical protein Q7R95_11430 [bacterium]|nr:hypothetical protein [bacterium]
MKYPHHFLIGTQVKADHPITVLNPEETFKIKEVSIDNNILYVRGENTMWFAQGLIKLVGISLDV